jgi:hypothetical protein
MTLFFLEGLLLTVAAFAFCLLTVVFVASCSWPSGSFVTPLLLLVLLVVVASACDSGIY